MDITYQPLRLVKLVELDASALQQLQDALLANLLITWIMTRRPASNQPLTALLLFQSVRAKLA